MAYSISWSTIWSAQIRHLLLKYEFDLQTELLVRSTNQMFDLEILIWSADRMFDIEILIRSADQIFDLVIRSADQIFDLEKII